MDPELFRRIELEGIRLRQILRHLRLQLRQQRRERRADRDDDRGKLGRGRWRALGGRCDGEEGYEHGCWVAELLSYFDRLVAGTSGAE